MKRAWLPATAILLGAGLALAQQDFSKVEVKATKIAGNVWVLEGAGGNIAVLSGPDGLLMVDSQFAPLEKKVRAALKTVDPKAKTVRMLVNTHWHGDHTGGNVGFAGEATILAHENVRKRVSVDAKTRIREVPALPAIARPIVTYSKDVTLHLNGEDVRVEHLPGGHTDGDSIVIFPAANVIHCGDQFVNGRFPFIDIESGGGAEAYARNLRAILERGNATTTFIPGHGRAGKAEDVRAALEMLEATIALVKGKSLEEARKQGLPEKWKSWGEGFLKTDAWIALVHESVNGPT